MSLAEQSRFHVLGKLQLVGNQSNQPEKQITGNNKTNLQTATLDTLKICRSESDSACNNVIPGSSVRQFACISWQLGASTSSKI